MRLIPSNIIFVWSLNNFLWSGSPFLAFGFWLLLAFGFLVSVDFRFFVEGRQEGRKVWLLLAFPKGRKKRRKAGRKSRKEQKSEKRKEERKEQGKEEGKGEKKQVGKVVNITNIYIISSSSSSSSSSSRAAPKRKKKQNKSQINSAGRRFRRACFSSPSLPKRRQFLPQLRKHVANGSRKTKHCSGNMVLIFLLKLHDSTVENGSVENKGAKVDVHVLATLST